MNINLVKKIMKEKKITQIKLSELTGVPLQTIKYIFTGRTKYPRIDTVEAIEKALGINETLEISAEDQELVRLIRQLTAEETEELTNYLDFIISKRK